MKLINAMIERMALVCVLITVAIFALFKPDMAARYLVEFLEGEFSPSPPAPLPPERGDNPKAKNNH